MSFTDSYTGDEEVLDAAAQGELETDEGEETTPPMSEDDDEQPDEVSFVDLFNEDDEGTGDNTGDTDLPGSESDEQADDQQDKQGGANGDYIPKSQVTDIVSKRLNAERKKHEAELAKSRPFGMSNEDLYNAAVEYQAQKLVEEGKKNGEEIPLTVARTLVKNNQPAPQKEPEQQKQQTDEERHEAWKQTVAEQEPMLALQLGRPGLTVGDYLKENATFKKAMSMGYSPLESLELAKAFESDLNAAKSQTAAAAKREVLSQVKKGNAKAMPQTTGSKGKGQIRSADEIIRNMTREDFERMDRMAEQGKLVTFE